MLSHKGRHEIRRKIPCCARAQQGILLCRRFPRKRIRPPTAVPGLIEQDSGKVPRNHMTPCKGQFVILLS